MTFVAPALLLLMGAVLAPPGVDAVTPGPGAGRTDPAHDSVPRVAILPERPQMPLSDGESLALQVEVLGVAPGTPLALRALANVGSALAPTPTGTFGRYVSRYLPPPTRFPQVAIIAVEATFAGDKHARGVLRVPMPAATEIPFRTDPDARVTLRVGDRTFGPVSADSTGKVKIPIVVPPGVAIGQARAINREGNLNETIVDLQPTPYPRALIVTPPHIVAGGMTDLAIYGVEPNGDATPANRVNLHASQGLVHAVDAVFAGEVRFLYEAPTTADLVTLDVTKTGDPGGATRLMIPVEAGPPHKVTLTPSTSWLVIGSGATARIGVAAQDRFGNRVPCQGATLLAAGAALPVDVAETGAASALVTAPEHYQGKDTLVLEARLGEARATTELLLSGGPPARLTAVPAAPSVVADGQHGVDLLVSAVDANGTPTLISGLSWELPGGHLDNVRKPRVGSYVAEFVPRRANEAHTETVAVMVSQTLRAEVTVHIDPPPPRVVATARVAFFSNLGSSSGPAAFVDLVRPFTGRAGSLSLGVRVGYLHNDLTAQPPTGQPAPGARVEINQFPLMGIARYRLALTAAEISLGAGLGLSLGRIRLTPPVASGAPPADSNGRALAVEVGAEAAFPLAPGRLVVGLRFLRIEFGHTTQNDEIRGNSAGLVTDLGYRLSF